jgi:protein SCO1/2
MLRTVVAIFSMAALSWLGQPSVAAHEHHGTVHFSRSTAHYEVPDVTLVREDGRPVQLNHELDDPRAVVLSFVYTSCTSVCPMTSATLSELQDKLGSARSLVHIVSISIDPEFDTPARLRDYAGKYGAGPGWQHYTGTLSASQRTQRAFDVYRGNKMDHAPVMLVRPQRGSAWVRMDGFATADQLMAELPVPPNAGTGGQSHAQR